MTFNKTRTHSWTATSAFVLSLAALGLSVWSVGCQEQEQAPPTATVAAKGETTPSQPSPAKAPSQPAKQATTPVNPQAPAAVNPSKSRIETSAAQGSVTIKRLVATKAIEKREPVAVDSFVADDGQTFAFLEVKNTQPQDAHLTLTFAHESGTKVGFISLNVPAEQPRWRTWGRTGQIKKAGKWDIVVSDEDGSELQRASFEVSPAKAAKKDDSTKKGENGAIKKAAAKEASAATRPQKVAAKAAD